MRIDKSFSTPARRLCNCHASRRVVKLPRPEGPHLEGAIHHPAVERPSQGTLRPIGGRQLGRHWSPQERFSDLNIARGVAIPASNFYRAGT